MATSIFSIIEGLTVTRDDILEAETFAEQYLSAEFPDYDFRQGTALRDMTVRPNATLLALMQKALVYYFDESDVVNITNATDNDIADRKLSNFFITRKTGSKSVINARLYFSFPTTTPISTQIPASAFFSPDNTIKFYPRGVINILAPALVPLPDTYYFKYDGSTDQWYVDVELESVDASVDANIESGDLLYFTIFSPYFLRAEVRSLLETAVNTETNEEMVSRAYTSVSTRNMINTPSIVARIGDVYNYVGQVLPIGLGSPWLYRDFIEMPDAVDPNIVRQFHRGGHSDIYLETDPILQTLQLTAVEDEEIPGEVAFYINGSIYEATRTLLAPANVDPDTVPYYVDPANPDAGTLPFTYSMSNVSAYDANSVPATPEADLGLSADQRTKIKFSQTLSIGDTASFEFKTFQGINSIQTGIDSEAERVVCADYLARSFEPVFIDLNVEMYSTPPADPTVFNDAIRAYVRAIPAGGTLYVSDIIRILTDNSIGSFRMPLDVKATRVPKDTNGNQTGPLGLVEESVVDSYTLNPIRKCYLRNVVYSEAT